MSTESTGSTSSPPAVPDKKRFGDSPLIDPRLDELGHADIARRIADDIREYAPAECIVFAINAPWGMGKSTVLNFIEHYLGGQPAAGQPTVVRFNPWWHGGEDGLMRGFFHQLLVGLAPEKAELAKLRRDVTRLAELLRLIPEPKVNFVSRLVAWITRARDKDLFSLKQEITELIAKRGIPVVILIDEVDRLTRQELTLLFRLIKAVVDFPGVAYVLAFDRDHVAKELQGEFSTSGRGFLEKIVQVQYELPPPVPTRLERMFFSRLDRVIRDVPEEDFDRQRWARVHFDGIRKLITSPRDVVRVTDALRLSFPKVIHEVDPVDFIALEVLRVKQPSVYEAIRDGEEMFAGSAEPPHLSRTDDVKARVKAFHDTWLGEVLETDREAAKALVIAMFPKLASVWGNTVYAELWEADWLRRRRICSKPIFPVYFRLEIPDGEFSRSEMRGAIDSTARAEDFTAVLRGLLKRKHPQGSTMARKLLIDLQQYTKSDIPASNIPLVVSVLFNIGDELLVPEDEPKGLFEFGNDIIIGRVLWQLLERLTEPERFSALVDAFRDGSAIGTMCRELRMYAGQHDESGSKPKKPVDERVLGADHVEVLKGIVLDKIRHLQLKGEGYRAVGLLPSIIWTWRWLAGSATEAEAWLRDTASADEGLAWLLERWVSQVKSQGANEYIPKQRPRLNPAWLEPALPRESIVGRVRSIADAPALLTTQRAAAKQYVLEYEMLAQGKDPDALGAFDD
jgi:predicted KAP-like P-loop ATPase